MKASRKERKIKKNNKKIDRSLYKVFNILFLLPYLRTSKEYFIFLGDLSQAACSFSFLLSLQAILHSALEERVRYGASVIGQLNVNGLRILVRNMGSHYINSNYIHNCCIFPSHIPFSS